MASDPERREALEETVRDAGNAVSGVLLVSRALDKRTRELLTDETVPEEARPAMASRERAEKAGEIREALAKARRLLEKAERQRERWHRTREIEPQAIETVRRLAAEKVPLRKIVEQAELARDRSILEAILREAPFLRVADGKLGSADQREITARAEDALARMSKAERRTVERIRKLEGLADRLEAAQTYASGVATGDANKRVSGRTMLGLTESAAGSGRR